MLATSYVVSSELLNRIERSIMQYYHSFIQYLYLTPYFSSIYHSPRVPHPDPLAPDVYSNF
jgi:hypothetical protein